VDPDILISTAIDAGVRDGIDALDAEQRLVFLISEAEVLCDMEGVEAFLARYAPRWLEDAVAAFEAVGATAIAAELRAAPLDGAVSDQRLKRLNDLITGRVGYNYETVKRMVVARRANL
jgi:hypothetical protein